MASCCSSASMISTWHFKGHALSSAGSKRNRTSTRTLERTSSRSGIRMDTTLRSVRCLQAEISMAAAEAARSCKGVPPPCVRPQSRVAKSPNANAPLRPFKGFGQMRERGDAKWFPVEFLIYCDDHNQLRRFAYVRREDGREIP